MKITIIGGGLAGSEAAYQIAKRDIDVDLYEMKPKKFSPAHSNKNLAEIVCSNSFKSNLLTNACGLLKEELRKLDSLLIKVADETSVPAGQALAVDREEFSRKATEELEKNEHIHIIHKEVTSKLYEDANYEKNNESPKNEKVYIEDLLKEGIVIIATGPLTSEGLYEGIKHLTGNGDLHFYDAEAPIIEKESIDFNIAFYGNRYDEERKRNESIEEWKNRIASQDKSYINLPMNKEEYISFCQALSEADVVTLRDFEKSEIFEGCMPIEIMCKRGIDTLRFGPLKPVGFTDPRTGKRPYAIVQLRQDNKESTLYNIVGFQTNLKYGEQKRAFSMIPGLNNASFAKYGVMHRNTFINSPKFLNSCYKFKNKDYDLYFAGQITGVEGYVESISSGLKASLSAIKEFYEKNTKESRDAYKNKELDKNYDDVCKKLEICENENTMIGALSKYISEENSHFQPMNANYGILKPLDTKIKDKKERYLQLSERSLELFK